MASNEFNKETDVIDWLIPNEHCDDIVMLENLENVWSGYNVNWLFENDGYKQGYSCIPIEIKWDAYNRKVLQDLHKEKLNNQLNESKKESNQDDNPCQLTITSKNNGVINMKEETPRIKKMLTDLDSLNATYRLEGKLQQSGYIYTKHDTKNDNHANTRMSEHPGNNYKNHPKGKNKKGHLFIDMLSTQSITEVNKYIEDEEKKKDFEDVKNKHCQLPTTLKGRGL